MRKVSDYQVDPFPSFIWLVTCQAGSHLFSRLEQLSSLQGTISVHILPPLQELSHGILDLLSANPLHDLQTHQTGITHTWNALRTTHFAYGVYHKRTKTIWHSSDH